MIIKERKETVRKFLADAEREFAAGDTLQASEKMWGAAAHAIMAVAQQRGWPFGNHRVMINAALRIASELDDGDLRAGVGIAQLCHINFYRDNIEPEHLEPYSEIVRLFVDRMLALVE